MSRRPLPSILHLFYPFLSSLADPYRPFAVAEIFTGMKGQLVPLKDTITGFEEILQGKHDDIPEAAFYMVGDINTVKEKAESMAKEAA